MSNNYTLYAWDISYFSGKMQAYMAYKEIPFDLVSPHWNTMVNTIYPATGLMKVPVVQTPDGLWLQDSTPMIDWFEERFTQSEVIPQDPYQAFFCRLLEDYADEWLWRSALHYRWSFEEDAQLLSKRFAATFLKQPLIPTAVTAARLRMRQYEIYVYGDGITDDTRTHVEAVYYRTLERMNNILENQPFLLGSKPSLADFGFMASMKRHFSEDPTPQRIMLDRAPEVFEWVSRLWAARASRTEGQFVEPGTIPDSWEPMLIDIGESYLPYLHRNALAWQNGESHFDIKIQDAPYRNLPTIHYRVWCRERLQEAFENLPDDTRLKVKTVLEKHGCYEPLMADRNIRSNLHESPPPVCQPSRVGLSEKTKLFFTGTSWNKPDTLIGGETVNPESAPLTQQLRRYFRFSRKR